jgi:D-alanyl-D-alanine-carboxypeptidase/D-alanyl-D-alanine-endopeptidase
MPTFTRRTMFGMVGAAAAGTAGLLPSSPAEASGATQARTVASLVDAALAQAVAAGVPGLVIGALDGGDEYVAGAGTTAGQGSSPPDGRTVYQLGSVTKTFTALLLAEAVEQRVVRLEDPLARYLPRGLTLPRPRRREITLRDVATQSSGLPSLPPNLLTMPGLDPLDPYAHYTQHDLADGLRSTKLLSRPGTTYLYSNLGFALLGQAMADLAGTDYADAVRRFATAPLGLWDTSVELTAERSARKASGHAADGTPTPDWHLPTFAGAGALYGTADDQMRYLRAMLGRAPARLRPALELVQQPRFTPPNLTGVRLALAWNLTLLPTSKRTMVWHNGETGGFTTFTGFCPETRTAVTALANIAEPDRLDATAAMLLDTLDARHS